METTEHTRAPASSSTRPTRRRGRSAPRSPSGCRPPTRPTRRWPPRPAALARRDFEVAANDSRAARRRPRSRTTDVLVIAHPSEPRWESTTGVGEPRLTRRRDRRDRRLGRGRRRADRARRDRAGQVRQQPQRAARPLRHRDRERDRPGLRAPPRRRAELDPRRPRSAPTAAAPTRSPASARPASTGPARSRSATAAAILARTFPSASAPDAPLAAVTSHGAGPRRRPRRLRPLRRRLHRGARPRGLLGQPRLLRGRAGVRLRRRADRVGGRRRSRLGRAFATRSRSCASHQAPDGSIDLAARRRRRGAPAASSSRRSRRRSRALAPHFPHQAAYFEALGRRSRRLGRRRASPSRTSWRSTEAFRPEQERRDGIEHLVVFPMYKQNGSPDTCFEALIVRVPWPRWAVELESRYDNAKFLPVEFVDYTSGYDSECAVLFPETFSVAERPAGSLRGDLLRPRGGALPPRRRRRRRHPAAEPAAGRRLPARLAGAVARRLHRLGPDPRPHPHARRPAVRPVHDPPAQPVLDVLAGGAALRPDGVRGGRQARGRGLRRSPATSSTRSSSTACSGSR